MPWYVVYTKPNSEKKVEQILQAKGVMCYCPKVSETRQWADRKKVVQTPLFKSYVFVNIADYAAGNIGILSTAGVVKFLWWLGKPGIVKDHEIEEIKTFLHKYSDFDIYVADKLKFGDPILIKKGVLSGQYGKFVNTRGNRAVLELESLGYKLTAVVPITSIQFNNSL
jgi:transcriptional antiterminator RfaH